MFYYFICCRSFQPLIVAPYAKPEVKGVPTTALTFAEAEVRRINELLGEETRQRIFINGYEIDVFARFTQGPIELSVIVE